MPDEYSDPQNNEQAEVLKQTGTELPTVLPRLSLKAGLTVYLLSGLFLYLLSHINYLLFHSLVEFASIVLLAAVFLIAWNTRHLVRNQFFVILAVGLFAAGMVDFLHTITYKGMHILEPDGGNTATQLWLVARTLGVFAFLCAIFNLDRQEFCSARSWLIGFIAAAVVMALLIWPLELFPTCLIEGDGLTPFKVYYEYVLVALLLLSASLLLLKRRYLNRSLVSLLLLAIGFGIVSEVMFTLYADVYGFFNFLGHYFKLGSVTLIYFALVEGTLRAPFSTLFKDMSDSYEELNQELQKRVAAERQQEV